MDISENIKKSFNFKGLPCVYFNNKYTLFDPYVLKSVNISDIDILKTENGVNQLKHNGFNLYNSFPEYDEPQNEKHLTFILTTDCNLACKYCYTQSKTDKLILNEKKALSIIDTLISDNYKGELFVQFFGGEPTMNFDTLRSIVKKIKEKTAKAFFYITTNGVMSQEKLDFLIENNIAFYLSLDGLKEYNDKNRIDKFGKSSFKKVEKTLNSLIQSKIPVKIRVTVTPDTVQGMPQLAEYVFKLGVRLIHFTPYAEVGYAIGINQSQNSEKFQDDFITNLDTVLDIAMKFNAKVLTPISLSMKKKPKPYCKIFNDDTKILITPEGKRTLCYGIHGKFNDYSQNFLYADYDTFSSQFISNEEIRENIRKSFKSSTTNVCSSCFAQFMCNGGCFVENLIENNSMGLPSENFCEMQKKIAYLLISRILKNN